VVAALGLPDREGALEAPFEIRFLDVGQGDAILLRTAGEDPVLVDAGPPGAAEGRLAELGVERLAALAITHDDLDHSGGLPELVGAIDVERLVTGPSGPPEACVRVACPPVTRVQAGSRVRLGRLRLDVLWPRRSGEPGEEPNATSLVLLASYGSFDALLPGDAERELAPYQAPPVELLKVAHHGSADAGLESLLEVASPDQAVISVGAGNPYGHPDPATIDSLESAGVEIARTDEDGEVVVEVGGDGWGVE
jgi:competence protein ComEC